MAAGTAALVAAAAVALGPARAAGEPGGVTAAPKRPVGCKRGGPPFRRFGPRDRKLVALTFDDGPGLYTAAVIRTLIRYRATATFFVIGNQIRGRERLLRRQLLNGMEIANHTWSHANLAAGGPAATSQLVRTNRAIRAATGFTPCLFRAPYNAYSRALIGRARAAGMMTIQWDTDPRDWSNPGAATIAARVLSAVRPGSIVVLHDGGGNRSQTVAALPRILSTLTRRGYKAVTVTRLLRHEIIYD